MECPHETVIREVGVCKVEIDYLDESVFLNGIYDSGRGMGVLVGRIRLKLTLCCCFLLLFNIIFGRGVSHGDIFV